MNSIRQIQALNKRELENAISPEASWHADYRDTAYIYIGGLPFDLSEGDIITIFSQYGEPVHVNLVRDKETGKSRGFAFLKYEDQRSTDLAVDNLGGATVLGRMLRVDHVRYKKRDEEEETDNVAKLMGEATNRDAGRDTDDDERRRGKKRRSNESRDRETRRRPLLKEEIELEELLKNHDEEDPMKEFFIEEKKEEVARALEKQARREKSSRKRDDSRDKSSRHSRHHRRHRHDDDRSRSRERSTRDYKERAGRDTSYRDRDPVHSRSPDTRRNRDRHDRRR